MWGVYDVIAHVTADSMNELKQVITDKIEKIDKINSKLTMIVSEDNNNYLREQLILKDEISF